MSSKKNTTAQENAYAIETTASDKQVANRDVLHQLFLKSPLPAEDLMFNLGMYVRGSLLVKFLVMSDIYKRIIKIPGVICEFGTWWGQNLVLLENLRAVYEPFNKQRKIIGFDTFSGYTEFSDRDKESDVWAESSYATSENYEGYLNDLLIAHESCNVLGHVTGQHQLIKGDVSETAVKYFEENTHEIVALAYFDIGLYEPTKDALMAIKPHLVPGSVILFDELTWPEAPGEALAFKEVFKDMKFTIEKCDLYPSKSIVTIV